ncbi:MAG: DUF3352 domain-containing protein [Actinomycetota bacterium]
MIPERLVELWEDLRWGSRRALGRLGAEGTRSADTRRVFRRRRQAAVIVLVLALYAIYRFVPVPGLPCEVSPAKTCVPTDHAIALVPIDAEGYLHIDLDPDSSQFSIAKDVASRLPHSGEIEQGIFGALGLGPRLDLRSDVAPWIGDEAAFAELGGGTPQPLVLLAVKDRKGAQRFLAKLGPGMPHLVRNGNAPFLAYRNGLAYADLHGFLALGPAPAVRAAIDTGRGRSKALSDSEQASAVRDSLPDQRLADAYFSAQGTKQLLAGSGGLASQLDTFVDFGGSDGIAAALVAHHNGLELQLDSALAPTKGKANPTFFQAFPDFHPSLAGEFSPDTLLYLEIADPADTVWALLHQAKAAAPGLVGAFARFQRQVRRGGVDIQKSVLPVLGGETAIGAASGRTGPYLTAVFKDVDEHRAREEMAKLQGPLVAALAPAQTGQAPSFGVKKLGDTVVRSVRISPTLNLAYAIFDGKLVVSTNPAGVRQAVQGDADLGGSDTFKAATSDASGGVSALVFFNLEGLVRRAEPLGLGQIVGGFGADVAKLKALGLTVRSDEDDLKTTLFLDIE